MALPGGYFTMPNSSERRLQPVKLGKSDRYEGVVGVEHLHEVLVVPDQIVEQMPGFLGHYREQRIAEVGVDARALRTEAMTRSNRIH